MYLLNLTWKVRIDKMTYLKDPKQSVFVQENTNVLALDNSFSSMLT